MEGALNLVNLFRNKVRNMEADELRTFLAVEPVGGYALIDVRQPSEYRSGHIAGASLIPLAELPGRLADIDRSKPVVVY